MEQSKRRRGAGRNLSSTPFKKKIGGMIRAAREDARMTLADVAILVPSLSKARLSRAERGEGALDIEEISATLGAVSMTGDKIRQIAAEIVGCTLDRSFAPITEYKKEDVRGFLHAVATSGEAVSEAELAHLLGVQQALPIPLNRGMIRELLSRHRQ